MDSDIDIDLSQFHAIFFEECAEGIAVMETELLNLDIGEPDLEVINTIFRAAHSIKGSAGTFGFPEISKFTHAMETVLDAMRAASLKIVQETISTLLSSVDCLREMIDCSQHEKSFDETIAKDLIIRLEGIIAEPENKSTTKAVADDSTLEVNDVVATAVWHISFMPNENLFFTGNDPFRLLRELGRLGELEVHADVSGLPDFSEMDVESCYLGWNLVLRGNVTQNDIEEVFAWVEGDCKLSINIEEDRRRQDDRRSSEGEVKIGRRKTDVSGKNRNESASIRVGTEKVDNLLNLVGELVITQSILSRVLSDLNLDDAEKLDETLELLERNTRDLQEQTMSIRMLPIDFSFKRLPRIVHDLSQALGKNIDLNISGEGTELDKTVLEKIGDPLVHLVRNAIDHGIESPEQRKLSGKPETGVINVSAHHLGGSIVIEIQDDGAGIDSAKVMSKAIASGLVAEGDELSQQQVQDLIFQPGFSTAIEVSDISGRGVGMDVVKRNITDLSGTVRLVSEPGVGSRFIIRLPLTLAILDGQMIRVANQIYIVPIHSIIETLLLEPEKVNLIADKVELYHYRDEYISIIRLHDLFDIECQAGQANQGLLVVIDIGDRRVGLYVDEVVGQQQVVIKSLESNYKQVDGLAGATVLGDGSVALILDVLGLSQFYRNMNMLSDDPVTELSVH